MIWWTEERVKDLADNHFAKHEVMLWTDNRLVWSEPRSSNSRVHYMIHGNVLIVWGDLGFAMYAWSQCVSWGFLGGLDLGYFASKCEASEVGRGFETWVHEAAKQHLTSLITDWRAEIEREDDYHTESIRMVEEEGGFDALVSKEEWMGWIVGREEQFWELSDLGMEIHARCVLHLEGLKRVAG